MNLDFWSKFPLRILHEFTQSKTTTEVVHTYLIINAKRIHIVITTNYNNKLSEKIEFQSFEKMNDHFFP